MDYKQLELIQHPKEEQLPIFLKCDLGLIDKRLAFVFSIEEYADMVVYPRGGKDAGRRQDELWKQTCFEFFISTRGNEGYWEFNFSPNGSWNVYRFVDYRMGMVREKKFTGMKIESHLEDGFFFLHSGISLDKISLADSPLQVGIAAVLVTVRGRSHWSLKHNSDLPDFHGRDSFILSL